MSKMVSWKDYDGVEGFGNASQSDVDSLNKALEAGQEINPPGSVTAGDGFALRVESLENTLKNTTFKMDHIRMWKAIPKIAAFNTVEEYNQIQSYGANPDAGWMDEGDLPESDDSSFERKFSIVKYIGTTRSVSHVMSLVKPAHGNVIAQETVNGTMHLLRVLERGLFYGDSDLSSLQFDGYEKLISDNSPATNIIDMRGAPLSEDSLTDGALTIQDSPNYGTPTHLFLNPKVKADLIKTFFPKERHDTFTASAGGLIGLNIRGYTSPAGDVSFEPDVFITDGGAPVGALGDAAKRPETPAITAAATTPGNADSQFGAADAGDYFYSVQAVNRYGRSAEVPYDGVNAITLVAGDDCRIGMTPGGSIAPDYYEVFRTALGGAIDTKRSILRIPNAAALGQQLLIDVNAELPYCSSAFLLQMNLEAMSFKQLAPMVKIPLATIDSSIRWMMLLYGVPCLYTPGKAVLYKNVGRAADYVGAP